HGALGYVCPAKYAACCHALTHPSHNARYIAINETVVGAVSIAGPLLGGLVANLAGLAASYATAVMLTLVTAIWLYRKHRSHQEVISKNFV
ncbi:MAG: hypothetical protein JKX85_02785, partial [Phycisphaeraceae bacterium]|nr:hypothetical protein [Phycisphaeraceae bacterium]